MLAFSGSESLAEHVIDKLLKNPSDQHFISNRNLLTKLNIERCDSSLIIVSDTLISSDKIKVEICFDQFEVNKHKIEFSEKNSIHKIDNRFPYGGQFGLPQTNISRLKINIGNRTVAIPDSAFSDLFNVNVCNTYSFFRQIEVYESLNGEFIYVYLFGGNAAGTWFAKLIFDHQKYLTRIVSDYVPLSSHGSFRDGFIGY